MRVGQEGRRGDHGERDVDLGALEKRLLFDLPSTDASLVGLFMRFSPLNDEKQVSMPFCYKAYCVALDVARADEPDRRRILQQKRALVVSLCCTIVACSSFSLAESFDGW